MEWYWIILIIIGGLLFLMVTGLPVAFCFMAINVIAGFVFMGSAGGDQLIRNIYTSLSTFTILPIPLFILMGEVMFHSGLGFEVIDTVDQWLGRLPGRLGLLAVGAGSILSALTGVSMASISILGSVLVPEMEKRGYQKSMSLGPILGSGGLAIMIPPSAMAVFLASVSEISVGKLLMAIIVPGILIRILVGIYGIQTNILSLFCLHILLKQYIPTWLWF